MFHGIFALFFLQLATLSLHALSSLSCTSTGKNRFCFCGKLAFPLSSINVLKDSLEQLPGLNPLPFFSHVELFTKGFFLPADAPQVIIEWVYQHPFYTPQQVERLVKIVVNGGGGGGLSAMKNMFNRNQFKGQGDPQRLASRQLLAQVTLVRGICVMRVGRNLTVCLQTRVYDSASSGGRGCQD